MKFWSVKTALEQITACGFACEAGLLDNSEAWQWLIAAAKVGPEFWPGQGVYFEVHAEAHGVTFSKWVHYYIVGCHMDSGSETRFWIYSLSDDPPAPYHYGKTQHTGVRADKLRLSLPIMTSAAQQET